MELARFHCELAWLGGDTADRDVLIEVQDDHIVAVTIGVPAVAGAARLRGLTLPGFANAHSHAFHRALRGHTHGVAGSFWTWREEMYALAAHLDPDSYLRLARAVFGEMALAGITCVGEFHYLHHRPDGGVYADPNEMGRALTGAAAEAGLRITLLDTCYLRGGFADRPLDPVQRRFSDGDVDAWAARIEAACALASPIARVGAAVHSVRAVAPVDIEIVAGVANASAMPLHVHVSEQAAENEQCLAVHGCTPTQLLAAHGALGAHCTAVHATHLTDEDVELLGTSTSVVCMCPTTERDLADGIGPTPRLVEAGARLTLGSDSHAVIDMMEEARAVEMDERLASGRRGTHAAASLLRAATTDGHASLGWADAGRIAPGALADLVTIRLDTVRTAGADAASALAHAVFASTAADVDHVVVGGRTVVSGGRHVALDVGAELAAAIAALRMLR